MRTYHNYHDLPVKYVNAAGTSTRCAVCGSKLVPEEHREMSCPICKSSVDRDVNAARNILLRGTRVVPDGIAGEAVMTELGIVSEIVPAICRVDAVKSSDGTYVPIT
ncbi:MAG: zinc ribbon domain-containing protein [Nitrososphaerota archaeon]